MSITTRQGNDATARFPELHPLAETLGSIDAILDGEIVLLDEHGTPELRAAATAHARELGVGRAPARGRAPGRAHDLRRAVARRPLDHGAALHRPPHAARPARARGPDVADPAHHLRRRARRCSPPRPSSVSKVSSPSASTAPTSPGDGPMRGARSSPRTGQELVVGGWLPGAGRLEGRLGSLLVGYHDDDGALQYAGRVGSGLDETARARLEQPPRTARPRRPARSRTRRS